MRNSSEIKPSFTEKFSHLTGKGLEKSSVNGAEGKSAEHCLEKNSRQTTRSLSREAERTMLDETGKCCVEDATQSKTRLNAQEAINLLSKVTAV